jgi:HAD superfamily hydrolase (TIGR01450 family)
MIGIGRDCTARPGTRGGVKIARSTLIVRPVPVNLSSFDAILLDLDGTVYYEEHPLPGSIELVRRLQREKLKFACISNATTSAARVNARLRNMGIDIEDRAHIYTAADAACELVLRRFPPRPRVFNLATEGVGETLEGKVVWVESIDEPCDAVIAGAPSNEYAGHERQRTALVLLRRGATLIGACNDRVYPGPRGLELGSGALCAMMSYASGVEPVFCGKPEPGFFHTLCRRLQVDPSRCLLVGDNLESDIVGAKALGMHTILTMTGVTRKSDVDSIATDRRPDGVIEDLRGLL